MAIMVKQFMAMIVTMVGKATVTMRTALTMMAMNR